MKLVMYYNNKKYRESLQELKAKVARVAGDDAFKSKFSFRDFLVSETFSALHPKLQLDTFESIVASEKRFNVLFRLVNADSISMMEISSPTDLKKIWETFSSSSAYRQLFKEPLSETGENLIFQMDVVKILF